MARRIIYKKNGLSDSSTPPSGYKYIGLNGEIYSEKDDDGTVTPISLLTGVSDVKLGGSASDLGVNWIWFNGIENMSQAGVTMSISVQSFIIDGQEQIGTPTVFQYQLSSTSIDMVGLTGGGIYGTGLNPTNVISSGYKIGIITEWGNHLNSLDNRFKFFNYGSDKILCPDLNWSIIIRRTFTPNYIDSGYNIEYQLNYLKSNNTSVTEFRNSPFNGSFSTLQYNPYNLVELSPFATLSKFK